MKQIAIIGCGRAGGHIADAMRKGLLEDYTLAGAMSHKMESAEKLCAGLGGKAVENLEELLALNPDIVIETASVAMARESCMPTLEHGASFIPLSIGAFADAEFYQKAQDAAKANGVRIYIPHGCVGGFDVLQTIALMAAADKKEIAAGIETHKGPASLKNTPVYKEEMEGEEVEAFYGTCEQAIALLPRQVNVAVAQSLATIGPEKATARIIAVPEYIGDDHKITVEMEGIKATVDIYTANSAMAGWSIVGLLRNLSSPVSFF